MAETAKRYVAKDFSHIKGIEGLSDTLLESHFKLYEGYVNRTNGLTERLQTMTREKKAAGSDPVYAELTRRLGFEYNGILLHELYFGNLTKQKSDSLPKGRLADALAKSFGDVESWLADFKAVSTIPGIGWSILYQNPTNGWLSNHWVGEHQDGHPAGFAPILVMDDWEHAYVPDFKPFERAKYLEVALSHIDWAAVEKRLVK